MNETALEVLGRLVVREVRDSTIGNYDRYLSGQARGEYADHVRRMVQEHQHDPNTLLHHLVPLLVDETIGIFLQVLDEHMEQVILQIDEGGKLTSPYEYTDALEAEYRPEDGWITTYSQERRTPLE